MDPRRCGGGGVEAEAGDLADEGRQGARGAPGDPGGQWSQEMDTYRTPVSLNHPYLSRAPDLATLSEGREEREGGEGGGGGEQGEQG